ncbi:hypothetical protein B0H17DRAFT_1122462 [Mycena rosella]|uniref:Uncharacterized protein n=1 Tax=Mycena rosella TaxID=1033263 RepID=A0AAD7AX59_MYCRO|nr:hypothetical protein B0H17DRAFT_1122462 [Mycena rosella]
MLIQVLSDVLVDLMMSSMLAHRATSMWDSGIERERLPYHVATTSSPKNHQILKRPRPSRAPANSNAARFAPSIASRTVCSSSTGHFSNSPSTVCYERRGLRLAIAPLDPPDSPTACIPARAAPTASPHPIKSDSSSRSVRDRARPRPRTERGTCDDIHIYEAHVHARGGHVARERGANEFERSVACVEYIAGQVRIRYPGIERWWGVRMQSTVSSARSVRRGAAGVY